MAEYLFLGGPKHGQWLELDGAPDYFNVRRPMDGSSLMLDPSSGVPILSAASVVTYRRQRLAGPTTYRDVYVDASLPPDAGMQALADALIAGFVMSGTPIPVRQEPAAPEPGPAAPLAGDQT